MVAKEQKLFVFANLDAKWAPCGQLTLTEDGATVREWKVLFDEYNVPADQIEKIAPAFRHIDEVSTPALRKLIP